MGPWKISGKSCGWWNIIPFRQMNMYPPVNQHSDCWNITIFNRKYIDSFRGPPFPASYVSIFWGVTGSQSVMHFLESPGVLTSFPHPYYPLHGSMGWRYIYLHSYHKHQPFDVLQHISSFYGDHGAIFFQGVYLLRKHFAWKRTLWSWHLLLPKSGKWWFTDSLEKKVTGILRIGT